MNLDCSICYITLNTKSKNLQKLPCSHNFCKDCLNKWFINNPTCPICRHNYSRLYLIDNYRSNILKKNNIKMNENFCKKYGIIGDIIYSNEIERLIDNIPLLNKTLNVNAEWFNRYIPLKSKNITNNLIEHGLFLCVHRKRKKTPDFYMIQPYKNYDNNEIEYIFNKFKNIYGITLTKSDEINTDFYLLKDLTIFKNW